jgi:hypothetical protein
MRAIDPGLDQQATKALALIPAPGPTTISLRRHPLWSHLRERRVQRKHKIHCG